MSKYPNIINIIYLLFQYWDHELSSLAQAASDQCTSTPTIPSSIVYSGPFSILIADRIDTSDQEENIDNSVVEEWFTCGGTGTACDDYKKVGISPVVNPFL